jgi:CheY-like chemotaxis protein
MVDILWAEDNALDRELIDEAIAALGVKADVEFAPDGTSVLHRMAQAQPRLIVLDIQLPDMTGLQVLERLVAADVQIPVVIFSSSGLARDVATAQRLGVADYVLKPLEFEALLNAVRRVLQWAK